MSHDPTRKQAGVSAWAAAALAATLGLSATSAWAAPQGAVREACAADVKALCSGVQPGEGRIVACMRQNVERLSRGCQQALQSARAARQSGS